MIVASIIILGGSLLIAANPDVPFNPLPLPTLPAVLEIPSPTPTIPSPTPSPTATASATYTPSTTATETATATASATYTPSATATATATPTETSTPVLPGLPPPSSATANPATPITAEGLPAQPGIIIPTGEVPPLGQITDAPFPFLARTITYQTSANGCEWLSIAGSVTGFLGEPLLNIPVEVTRSQFAEVRFSGTAPRFGGSGFEINVGNRPISQNFSVRLLSPTGQSLSDFVVVETGATCEENVAFIAFYQVRDY